MCHKQGSNTRLPGPERRFRIKFTNAPSRNRTQDQGIQTSAQKKSNGIKQMRALGLEPALGRFMSACPKRRCFRADPSQSTGGGGRWFPPSSPAVSGGAPPSPSAEFKKIYIVGKVSTSRSRISCYLSLNQHIFHESKARSFMHQTLIHHNSFNIHPNSTKFISESSAFKDLQDHGNKLKNKEVRVFTNLLCSDQK